VFFAKSAEPIENKRVEFLPSAKKCKKVQESAKKCKRVRKNLKRKEIVQNVWTGSKFPKIHPGSPGRVGVNGMRI
jgi:hypothetical protein